MSPIRRKFILKVNIGSLSYVVQPLSNESEIMSSIHRAIFTPPWDIFTNGRAFQIHAALFGANYLHVATNPPPSAIPRATRVPMFTRPEPVETFVRSTPMYYNTVSTNVVTLVGPFGQLMENVLEFTYDVSSGITIDFPGPSCSFTTNFNVSLKGYDNAGNPYVMGSGPTPGGTSTFIYQETYTTTGPARWTAFIIGFSIASKSVGPIWTHALWFRLPVNASFGTIARNRLDDAVKYAIN